MEPAAERTWRGSLSLAGNSLLRLRLDSLTAVAAPRIKYPLHFDEFFDLLNSALLCTKMIKMLLKII